MRKHGAAPSASRGPSSDRALFSSSVCVMAQGCEGVALWGPLTWRRRLRGQLVSSAVPEGSSLFLSIFSFLKAGTLLIQLTES